MYQLELAGALIEQRRGADAEPLARAALETHIRLAEEAPDVSDYVAEVARNRAVLGQSLHLQNRLGEAETEYAAAIPEMMRAAQLRPDRAETVTTLAGCRAMYGQLLMNAERPSQALEQFDDAIAILRPLDGRSDAPAAASQYLTLSLERRARALLALRRAGESVAAWDEFFRRESRAGPEQRVRYAQALVRSGAAKAALEVLESLKQPNVPAGTVFEIARCYALLVSDMELGDQARTIALTALGACEKAGLFRDHSRLAELRSHDDWSGLRNTAGFRELLSRIGGDE
jgi:tetratricopeptide (TPR) repeat protein